MTLEIALPAKPRRRKKGSPVLVKTFYPQKDADWRVKIHTDKWLEHRSYETTNPITVARYYRRACIYEVLHWATVNEPCFTVESLIKLIKEVGNLPEDSYPTLALTIGSILKPLVNQGWFVVALQPLVGSSDGSDTE